MLSPKIQTNISRIIPFSLISLTFGLIYSLLEKGLLGNLKSYPSTGNAYNFTGTFFTNAITAFIFGVLVGTIEFQYFYKFFLGLRFIQKLLLKTIIYAQIVVFFLVINSLIYNSIELHTSILNKLVWIHVWAFLSSFYCWSVVLYLAAVLGVCLFYAEVSGNLGQGVLNNFFRGKYHKPVEEERIFMFLDIRSSTRIAKMIGHAKYFQMLKEYYSDLSEAIIMHSGEIYQYVGDEVIVSWNLKKGLKDNNCLQCFFAIKEAIRSRVEKYNEKFGLSPESKAGFHFGKMITGQIGVTKKDIVFTGDVLNTTSRIQELCNTYEVDLLISDDLMKRIDLHSQFQTIELADGELRGRDGKIKLFTIVPC